MSYVRLRGLGQEPNIIRRLNECLVHEVWSNVSLTIGKRRNACRADSFATSASSWSSEVKVGKFLGAGVVALVVQWVWPINILSTPRLGLRDCVEWYVSSGWDN